MLARGLVSRGAGRATLCAALALAAWGGALVAAEQASSHYEVLGISPAASQREVQRAYRRAALLEHPDKSSQPDAEQRFRRVAEAFEVLGHPELRELYDRGATHDETWQSEWSRSEAFVDPYELFRDQVGDVYQHWQPGYRVEGDILRNHERIRVVLYPDGSSDVRESEDSGMHRFRKVGVGWCLFDYDPAMMAAEGLDELQCRQKCVEMNPSCEAYAFEEGSHACELYRRENPPQPVAAADGTRQATCYQQDDTAFDAASSIFKSVITVTKPDGTQSGVTRVMFCKQQPTRPAVDSAQVSAAWQAAAEAEAALDGSWWAAAARAAQRLLGAEL